MQRQSSGDMGHVPKRKMFTASTAHSRVLILFVAALLLVTAFRSVNAQDETPTAESAVALFNQGQDAHEKGDLQRAIQLYQDALKILPEFPEAEYQRGMALAAIGKTAEAENAFRSAVSLREDWTLALTALGGILTRENKFEEAEKLLTKAVSLDSANAARPDSAR